MDVIPDTEAYRIPAEAGVHNLGTVGVEAKAPRRVIYGFTPRGGASYDVVTDTVYMGAATAARDDRAELATFEHETVHYEQFRRMLGESPQDIYEKVAAVEDQALNVALDRFDESGFIDALTHEQHLNYHNFRTMMGLATENEDFLDELHDLQRSAVERMQHLDADNPGLEETPEEVSYNAAAETAEKVAEDYWNQILETDEAAQVEVLVDRYDTEVEDDDVLEAQAQFWSMFTIGMLEDLPEAEGVYPEIVEKQIESLDSYSYKEHYNRGENVEEETRNIVEVFRQRKHSEEKNDMDIAVEILNNGLERWERGSKVAAD